MHVHCPYCQTQLAPPDSLLGQVVSCPRCKQLLQLPAAAAVPPLVPFSFTPPLITPRHHERDEAPPDVCGIISMLLAVIALIFVWAPIPVYVILAMTISSLILGGVGIAVAQSREGNWLASLIGLLISLPLLFVVISLLVAYEQARRSGLLP